jgi:hypothetical protein
MKRRLLISSSLVLGGGEGLGRGGDGIQLGALAPGGQGIDGHWNGPDLIAALAGAHKFKLLARYLPLTSVAKWQQLAENSTKGSWNRQVSVIAFSVP